MDGLSVASGVAGLVSLADIVFSRTYKFVREVRSAEKDISKLAQEIRNLSSLLHGLSLVFVELEQESSESNIQLHHLNSCRVTLRTIEKKLDSCSPEGNGKKLERVLGKLKWPFSSTETKELINEVERHKTVINVALAADNLTTALKALSRQNQLANDVAKIKSDLNSRWTVETQIALGNKRKEVLQFFEKVDPTSNQRSNAQLRHPLTGLWLTDGQVFQTWLHSRNSKLWLSGIPGSGKTCLSSLAVEYILEECSDRQAAAYFYCDYKDAEKQNPLTILGCIAAQLARQKEQAFLLLQDLYNVCHPEDRPPIPPELSSLLRTIRSLLSCFDDTSIVVDGLDECGIQTSTAVESLVSLVSEESTTRLLILSRDTPEIRGLLGEEFVSMEVAAHNEDLRMYVAAEIDKRAKKSGRGQLRIINPELKDHITQTLVEKSAGMFRWVACQLDYLCELRTDAAKRKALESLPPTLHETYERIFDNITSRGSDEQEMVSSLLRWLIYAKEKLATPALCHAVSLREGDVMVDPEAIVDEDSLLDCCSSLVRKNFSTGLLELAHFTVQEFVNQIKPNSRFAPYAQPIVVAHPQLARICLTYLNMDVFRGFIPERLDEWDDQMILYPLRIYAIRFWFIHARYAWDDEEILKLARCLLNPSKSLNFLSWARDYYYLDDFHLIWKLESHHTDATAEDGYQLYQPKLIGSTEQVCDGGTTPLHLAAAIHYPQLCQWLLESGCNVNQTDRCGTPLHSLFFGIDYWRVVHEGAKFFWVGAYGTINDQENILRLFLRHGADLLIPFTSLKGRIHTTARLACFVFSDKILPNSNQYKFISTLIIAATKMDYGPHLVFIEALVNEMNTLGEFQQDVFEKILKILDENDVSTDIRKVVAAGVPSSKSQPKPRISSTENLKLNCLGDTDLVTSIERAIRFDQPHDITRLFEQNSSSHDGLALAGLAPLHLAAKYNSVKTMKVLLSQGADPNTVCEEGFSPLHLALKNREKESECMMTLLDAGTSIDFVHAETGQTAWHMAAANNNFGALQELVSRDKHLVESLSTRDREGLTPLIYAAKSNSNRAVEYLLSLPHLQQQIECLEELPDGLKLIHHVVPLNSTKLLVTLKNRGHDFGQSTADGRNPLHFIPKDVDPSVVKMLVENGVSPEATTVDGISPLHRFLELGISDEKVVFDMLATEKSLSLVTKSGHAPIHLAVMHSFDAGSHARSSPYVQWLIERGADTSLRGNDGRSILQLVMDAFRSHIETQPYVNPILITVVDACDDLEVLNDIYDFGRERCTLLCKAIQDHQEQLIELLLSKGVDVDIPCPKIDNRELVWSAIHFACVCGSSDQIFESILQKTKKLKERDGEGWYLTHLVCTSSHSESGLYHLKRLCESGTESNARSVNEYAETPLMSASRLGRVDLVEYLLSIGVDYRVADSTGCLAPHRAIKDSRVDILSLFAKLDIDWHHEVAVWVHGESSFRYKCNALHLAACRASAEIVRYILKHSLIQDINGLNGDGFSALHLASRFSGVDVVEELISAGANVDQQSSSGLRAIHYAIYTGNSGVLKALLAHGCLLVDDSNGLSLELHILQAGQEDMLSILKQHSPQAIQLDVSVQEGLQSNSGQRAARNTVFHPQALRSLDLAISQGNLQLCKTLVEHGVSLEKSLHGCPGCTPVLRALLFDQIDIASYFVEEGASTLGQLCECLGWERSSGRVTCRGYSAVHLACRVPSSVDLLKRFLVEDARAGSPAFSSAVSPLHIAVACKNDAALKLILEHNPGVILERESKKSDGCLALQSLVPSCDADISAKAYGIACDHVITKSSLKWQWPLSQSGTWHTSRFSSGTALHLAARSNNVTAAHILLEHGANVYLSDDDGRTPLHVAAQKGYLEIVSSLLQHGASPNVRTKDGDTPAMVAASEGHVECLVMLIGSGDENSHESFFGANLMHQVARRSPEATSLLLSKGFNPYRKDSRGLTAVDYAFGSSKDHPALGSLMCNWELDYDRLPGLMVYPRGISAKLLKSLLRRLPKPYTARELDINSHLYRIGTPLSRAAAQDRTDFMEMLINEGANLEADSGAENQGSPLVVACSGGRLAATKCLVRAGAQLIGTKGDRPYSALEAAKDFPAIIQWLLVQRHTEQKKLTTTCFDEAERVVQKWSGVRTAEVIITGLYAPSPKFPMIQRMVDLVEIRREFYGKVVRVHCWVD